MPAITRWTRRAGAVLAICLLMLMTWLFVASLHNHGFTPAFFWRQVVPVYAPYFALSVLLLLPFSRIQNSSIRKSLFVALVVLSLYWFVPAAHHGVTAPSIQAEKPPGEDVPSKIIIHRSYDELIGAVLIAGFLAAQMVAIWSIHRQATTRPPV